MGERENEEPIYHTHLQAGGVLQKDQLGLREKRRHGEGSSDGLRNPKQLKERKYVKTAKNNLTTWLQTSLFHRNKIFISL